MPEASYRASGLMGTSESGAIVGANPLLCSLLFLGGVGGGLVRSAQRHMMSNGTRLNDGGIMTVSVWPASKTEDIILVPWNPFLGENHWCL